MRLREVQPCGVFSDGLLTKEQKDPFYEVLNGVLKDIYPRIQLVNAIPEGEKTEVLSREQVLKILESGL